MRYVLYDDDCQFCSNLVKKTSSLIEGSVILFFSFNSVKGKKLISNYNIENIDYYIIITIYVSKSQERFKAQAQKKNENPIK